MTARSSTRLRNRSNSHSSSLLVSQLLLLLLVLLLGTRGVSDVSLCREKLKLKERDEVWHKIEELARQNPQVVSFVPPDDSACFFFQYALVFFLILFS